MYEIKSRKDYYVTGCIHVLYCLLYILSVMAALWQHGEVEISLFAMLLGVPVSLLPLFPSLHAELTRTLMQMFFPVVAGFWLIYRFGGRVPSDKFLIESLSIAGYAFAFTMCRKDRGFFLTICGILIIYGGVYPRDIFVYLLPVLGLLFSLILYLSRMDALGSVSDGEVSSCQMPRGPWFYLIPQYGLMMLLAFCLYWVMPSQDEGTTGYIPSDFSMRYGHVPPGLRDWFRTRRFARGRDGVRAISGDNPEVSTEDAGKKMPGTGRSMGMDVSGGGTSLPGNELVFTVRCDSKLYWMACIYDEYDGVVWKTSKEMLDQEYRFSWEASRVYISVKQDFTLRNWYSRALYCAYMPTYCYAERLSERWIRQGFFGVKLSEKMEQQLGLPFRYTVNSMVPFSKVAPENRELLWWESLDRGHYLSLPEGKISGRLRSLSEDLTRGAVSDLEKAIRIRDYLRGGYKYTHIPAKPLPSGAEGADFFLFDLKAGHCEYFACAMAVLCRLAGLPSRVATGFSPGNYNLITREFEVYEYHAHAWVQVFIEELGWQTFDATPQSSVPSRTTPFGLGMLKDPFGDEWRISTPEMSRTTQRLASPYTESQVGLIEVEKYEMTAEFVPSKLDMLLTRIPSDGYELQQSFQEIKDRMMGEKSFVERSFESFKSNMKSLKERVVSLFFMIAGMIFSIRGLVAMIFVLGLYPAIHYARRLRVAVRRSVMRRRCEMMYDSAIRDLKIAPDASIRESYGAVRSLLDLSGLSNSSRMELFEYGASLGAVSLHLSRNALAVFHIYTRLSYSMGVVDETDSEEALQRALLVRGELDQYWRR